MIASSIGQMQSVAAGDATRNAREEVTRGRKPHLYVQSGCADTRRCGHPVSSSVVEGRVEAFDDFVENFRTRVFQYSYLMCGHREDAEEVAQDTLLKVFENFASLREPEKVRSWLFRIAKNACLMKRRRSIFAPEHEISLERYAHDPGPDGGQYGREIAGDRELPDAELYRQEMNTSLTRAIEQFRRTIGLLSSSAILNNSRPRRRRRFSM